MKDSAPGYEADLPVDYRQAATGRPLRTRRRWALLILFLIVAAVGATWAYLTQSAPRQEAAPARRGPVVPEVTVVLVERREAVISLRSVGTVQPIKSVQIMPQVEGPIMRVGFSDGQTVPAGQMLFEIDPRSYQAALAQTQGQVASDQATLQSAKQDFARTTRLAESGFAARQILDQQRSRVAQLEAAVQTGRARMAQARIDLERTTIRAPIAGRLSAVQQTEGNIVRAGQQAALTTIVQIAPIDVQFTLPQDQLVAVQARDGDGAPVGVVVSTSDDGAELGRGKLVFIDNRVDPTTGTVAMKARFTNEDTRLWPGQFVNVSLELERRRDAVVVDSRAVQTGPQGRFVYVVQDGKAEARTVKIVELHERSGIVSEGLKGGEQVIIDGQLKVVPGAPVRVREPQGRRDASSPTAATAGARAAP